MPTCHLPCRISAGTFYALTNCILFQFSLILFKNTFIEKLNQLKDTSKDYVLVNMDVNNDTLIYLTMKKVIKDSLRKKQTNI